MTRQSMTGGNGQQMASDLKQTLSTVYLAVLYQCASMVIYALVAPAPWLMKDSEFHRETILPFLEAREASGAFRVASKHIITKNQDQPLVYTCSILPTALWAFTIAFLLHPTWRKNHPTLHGFLGFLLPVISFARAMGFFKLVEKGLTFDQLYPDASPFGHGFTPLIAIPIILILKVWFVMTLCQANWTIIAARIHPRSLSACLIEERKWMFRHVAAGIWGMTQRFVIYPLYILYYDITIPRPAEIPSAIQRKVYADSALLSAFLCLCLAEFVIRRVETSEVSVAYTTPETDASSESCEAQEGAPDALTSEAPSDSFEMSVHAAPTPKASTPKASAPKAMSKPGKCEACGIESEFVPEGMVGCDCNQAVYCSKDCQNWHRKAHQITCSCSPELSPKTDKVAISGTEEEEEEEDDDADSIDPFAFDPNVERPRPVMRGSIMGPLITMEKNELFPAIPEGLLRSKTS